MQRWRLVSNLLTALVVAGCTLGGGGTSSPDEAGTLSEREDVAGVDEQNMPSEAGEVESPAFLVEPAPGILERVVYGSTLDLPGPGYYVVDLSTGQAVAWRLPSGSAEQASGHLSEDRRWVIAQGDGQIYWANRETGDTFAWRPDDLTLLATGPDRFLFSQEAQEKSRTFYVADAQFQLQHTFSLDLGDQAVTRTQFAPDGTRVALATERYGASETGADARVHLVDLTSGSVLDLGDPPSPAIGRVLAVELLKPAPGELVASYVIQVMEPPGVTREESIVRRYSWNGELLSEFPVPGRASGLSPDGRLITSAQDLYHLARTTVVTDLSTGEPLFRVVNASGARWMADGEDFLLEGPDDGEFLISRGGALRPAPAIPGGPRPPVWIAHLVPAPDDRDRFLAGLSVVDEGGQVVDSIQLPDRDDWLVPNPEWGASSDEVVLKIYPRVGKGNIGYDIPLPAVVQKAPFPDPYLLVVQDSQGECLNLRADSFTSSPVVRCLPSGTRLAVADLFEAPIKMNEATMYQDGHIWLWTRTEEGEVGWVSLSTGSVTWIQ